jgi:hypothetical protein
VGSFKALTRENWSAPDETSQIFVELNIGSGEKRQLTGDRLVEVFLGAELDDTVPQDIRDMWEVARGVLAYGWFFYPLYALGEDQLHRVADAAVLARYQQLDGPRDRRGQWPSLYARLEWLVQQGQFDEPLRRQWDAIRELRNYGSHATYARISMPLDAMRTLELLAREINGLFAASANDA